MKSFSISKAIKVLQSIFSQKEVKRSYFKQKKEAHKQFKELIPDPKIWGAFFLPNDRGLIKKHQKDLEALLSKDYQKYIKLKKKALNLLESKTKLKKLSQLKDPFDPIGEVVALALLELLYLIDAEKTEKILLQDVRNYWIPLSDHFGLWKIRYQLEDRWFALSDPREYKLVVSLRSKAERIHVQLFKDIREILSHKLKQKSLKGFKILYRKKNLYGLYEKMRRKDLNINHITDLFAMRVIVKNEAECYQALEALHYLWPPFPDKIKDYIKKPKPNGYQSLHTTLHCLGGQTVEFQVRSRQMDEAAKFGPAAHAEYKKGVRSKESGIS